jgi:hypothetical protein
MINPAIVTEGLHVKVGPLNDALLEGVPHECQPLIKYRKAGAIGKVAYIPLRQGPIAIFSVVQHDAPTESIRGVYHCDELEEFLASKGTSN